MEGAVAAAEDAVVLGEFGELLGHPQLAPAAQVGEDRQLRARARPPPRWAKPSSNSMPLDHWWFTGRPSWTKRGDRGRPFVRQHDGVAAVEHGGYQRGGGDDGGDGHVAIEEAELVRAPDEGIDLAGDAGDGEPGDRGGVFDGGEPLAREDGPRRGRHRGARARQRRRPSRWSRCHRRTGSADAAVGGT